MSSAYLSCKNLCALCWLKHLLSKISVQNCGSQQVNLNIQKEKDPGHQTHVKSKFLN